MTIDSLEKLINDPSPAKPLSEGQEKLLREKLKASEEQLTSYMKDFPLTRYGLIKLMESMKISWKTDCFKTIDGKETTLSLRAIVEILEKMGWMVRSDYSKKLITPSLEHIKNPGVWAERLPVYYGY